MDLKTISTSRTHTLAPTQELKLTRNFYSKHIRQKHDRHIPCKANQDDSITCEIYFGDNRDMERHVWAHHRPFAEDPANGIRRQDGECPWCARKIRRKDNLARHIDEKHLGIPRKKSKC